MALLPPLIPLTDGQVAEASQVQANFNTIRNDYNGNITNANLSGSAGITDANLATISTPNKVNATAFIDEGDWTAGFTASISGTITMDNSRDTGHYVKIGKMVTVTGYFKVASVSSPVGILTLTGLPFTCGNDDKYYSAASIRVSSLVVTALTTIMGYPNKNSKTMTLEKFAAGAVNDLAGDVQANSDFMISCTYFTD
jgi:hypothetical protein